ncbi:MAG: hypothetical protein ABJN65_04150 [Parasphingorhabdus sp.]
MSEIDWVATGAMLQGWATIAGAVAVAYAAKVGADSFENWRKQKVTERRIGQAERILTAAYKAKRALKAIRSPMMSGYELLLAEDKLKENMNLWDQKNQQERNKLKSLQAYYHRLERSRSEQDELDECSPIARAYFGENAEKAIQDLNHQFWIVQVDAESYSEDNGQDLEFTKKLRRGIWDVAPGDEVNEVTNRINDCVDILEKQCLPDVRD